MTIKAPLVRARRSSSRSPGRGRWLPPLAMALAACQPPRPAPPDPAPPETRRDAAWASPADAAAPAHEAGSSDPDASGQPPPATAPDAAAPNVGVPVDPATVDPFDTTRLHRVEITVAPEHLPQLESVFGAVDVQRVPCTIVFDGAVLPLSGIRKKGGRGSWRLLAEKAGFSIKLNEFVKGQKLGKLSKLLLNNAIQDKTLLNEHLMYEIARRAGMAAPFTAHAAVTFNGEPYGYFVVREAINDDFLRRSFGKDNEDGNLYEGVGGQDFVRSPLRLELKDEVEEMRSRADLKEAAEVVYKTPAPGWLAAVSAKLDLPSFITGYALELVSWHWDGYFFHPNNYFIYNHPGLKRFVFILAGTDVVFGRLPDGIENPPPDVFLGKKLLELPETHDQIATRVMEILRDLDVPALLARIDQVERLLRGHGATEQRFRDELKFFLERVAMKRTQMKTLQAWRPMPPPPPPTDGPVRDGPPLTKG